MIITNTSEAYQRFAAFPLWRLKAVEILLRAIHGTHNHMSVFDMYHLLMTTTLGDAGHLPKADNKMLNKLVRELFK